MFWFISEFLENDSISTYIFFKAESSSPNEMIEMFCVYFVQRGSYEVHMAIEHLNVVSDTKKWNL